jgi:Putative peptidoglycan binding domain
MNTKSLVVCVLAATSAVSVALAGSPPRGSSFAVPQSGATINRGTVSPGSAGFNRAPVTSSNGRWTGGSWNGSRGNWNRWHGDWHHHDRFFFAGSFGFPFRGWGYPAFGWGYPYSYYPYGGYYGGAYYGAGYYPGGYPGYYSGARYGYGDQGDRADVVQLQRRLKAAGYYHGSIDGIMGPRTRSALRAYQRNRGMAGNNYAPPQSY